VVMTNAKVEGVYGYPNVLLFTLGFSIVALLLSYSVQYVWGMEPRAIAYKLLSI